MILIFKERNMKFYFLILILLFQYHWCKSIIVGDNKNIMVYLKNQKADKLLNKANYT